MDPASEALPDDVAALKAALVAERARLLEVAAELAVARAKASEDMALIAAQKLRIAKLERQVYGQRSERSARLVDQLALAFEELAATATQHVLAAENAVAIATSVRRMTGGRQFPTLRFAATIFRIRLEAVTGGPSRLGLRTARTRPSAYD